MSFFSFQSSRAAAATPAQQGSSYHVLALAATWVFGVPHVPARHGLERVAITSRVPLTLKHNGFLFTVSLKVSCLVTGINKDKFYRKSILPSYVFTTKLVAALQI